MGNLCNKAPTDEQTASCCSKIYSLKNTMKDKVFISSCCNSVNTVPETPAQTPETPAQPPPLHLNGIVILDVELELDHN